MKQQKEIPLNKMKHIFFCVALLFVSGCKQSIKEPTVINKKNVEITSKTESYQQIDFLDKKYQENGLTIPDDLNGDLYPSYSYYDKSIGTFSVNYIGKNDESRYYWNIKNPEGYFSNNQNNPESSAKNSSAIKQATNNGNYYILADYIPSKYIKYIGGEDEEFEILEGAITSFYLYEDSKWFKVGETETKKVPERTLQYFMDLIETHVKKSPQKISWNGIYNLNLDYGKLDEFSEMSIEYQIEIAENKCTLSGLGYKTFFTDLCKTENVGDTLLLKYIKTVDGDGFTNHSAQKILAKLFKKKGDFYVKSAIIADSNWNYDTELKLNKK